METLEIGQKLDPNKFEGRHFYIKEIINFMGCHGIILWSWGFSNPTGVEGKYISFNVNGRKHKGKVFIFLHWSDTFTIVYTNRLLKIKKIDEMVYIDELMERLDNSIET